jgi:rare lipoprotein A
LPLFFSFSQEGPGNSSRYNVYNRSILIPHQIDSLITNSNKSQTFIPILLLAFLLISCAYRPYEYKPRPGEGYEDFVTASWYGSDFHGNPTSSGERFDMYDMTCAHRTFDFGTKLRVTNPDNNKSVVVTVNDRGPFIRGRDLDLSYGAAREIGLTEKGVGTVKIAYLGRDMRYVKRVPFQPISASQGLTVQVGSFIELTNAFRLKQGLDLAYQDVYVTSVLLNGQQFYRVRVGKFSSYDTAFALAEKLADEGYDTLIVSEN